MSVVISGVLIISSFLLASVLMFGTFLTTSNTQAQSIRNLGRLNQQKASSEISITSGTVTSPVTGSGTDMTLLVDNIGSQSVQSFDEMDVIVQYTNSSDGTVLKYLTYSDGGAGDNQWTYPATGITPDTFNPRMWDPDETITLELRVAPSVKQGTSALVVVSTPKAASDRTSVSNN